MGYFAQFYKNSYFLGTYSCTRKLLKTVLSILTTCIKLTLYFVLLKIPYEANANSQDYCIEMVNETLR